MLMAEVCCHFFRGLSTRYGNRYKELQQVSCIRHLFVHVFHCQAWVSDPSASWHKSECFLHRNKFSLHHSSTPIISHLYPFFTDSEVYFPICWLIPSILCFSALPSLLLKLSGQVTQQQSQHARDLHLVFSNA